jgi:hypothetical protein
MKAMYSKQIFMMIAIFTALSAAMIATPVMAQNMTDSENVTGPNMTAGAGGPAAEGGESEDEEDEEDEGEGDNEEEQEGGN